MYSIGYSHSDKVYMMNGLAVVRSPIVAGPRVLLKL